jgi:hypothetical protein
VSLASSTPTRIRNESTRNSHIGASAAISGRPPAASRRAPLERPVLLAVDQELGEGRRRLDPVTSIQRLGDLLIGPIEPPGLVLLDHPGARVAEPERRLRPNER